MRRNHYIIIIAALILSLMACNRKPITTQEQSKAERLLNAASELTAMSRPDSALTLLDSVLNLNGIDDTVHAMAVGEKANNMLILGRMADALPLCRQAISEGERIGSDEVLINQYSTCGIVYRRLGLADSAMWAYQHGIEVSKRVGLKDYVANLYNNIAVMYVETDRLREGISYADEATRWATEAKDTIEMFSALATKASALLKQDNYRDARQTIAPHFDEILSTGSTPLALKTASPMLQSCVKLSLLDEADRYLRQLQPVMQKVEPASNGSLGILEIEAALMHARHNYKDELALWNRIETLCKIVSNKVEAMEFRVTASADFCGIPLQDLHLKDGLLIGCISRGGKTITPRGSDTIEVGDSVIVVAAHSGLRSLNDIFTTRR